MKPCGCVGACSQDCRNDRAALRRAARIRREGPPGSVNATQARLKPSALAILGLLQRRGPCAHYELMDVAGFRYSARIYELRQAGHVIMVTAPGPTPGVRVYRLETSAQGAGGKVVDSGKPSPAQDVPEASETRA